MSGDRQRIPEVEILDAVAAMTDRQELLDLLGTRFPGWLIWTKSVQGELHWCARRTGNLAITHRNTTEGVFYFVEISDPVAFTELLVYQTSRDGELTRQDRGKSGEKSESEGRMVQKHFQ